MTAVKQVYESIKPDTTEEYAIQMDKLDPLKKFRDEFILPVSNDCDDRKEVIYFVGFGVGPQPKRTLINVNEAIIEWGKLGTASYTQGKRPLRFVEARSEELLMPIMGAKYRTEVAVMNSCSVNANLLMTSFYRPNATQYKILIEKGAFCSDYHIIKGQFKIHNITKSDALIEVYTNNQFGMIVDNDDIIDAIHEHNTSISMIWLGCVQYLSGQVFDIARICSVAHQYNICVGLDLAHGVGNIPLKLHDWGVDFATFCSYKYLNASGGGIGGIFVHEKHHYTDLPKHNGWWGQDVAVRHKFSPDFKSTIGAKSWAISQTPLLSCVALESSLEIFNEAGILNLREKSVKLTGYLERLSKKYLSKYMILITPSNANERGCQLSFALLHPEKHIDALNKYLSKNGVSCNIRQPFVLRAAPNPLYNTFTECWQFVQILKRYYQQFSAKL
eukprot:245809_1